ncbi:MAG: MFS transporter [Coxiellaceae bacterium]|nr:MFS transporter [Coxiellaceae bacterium]
MNSESVIASTGAAATPHWQPWLVSLSSALFFFFIFIQINMFNAVSPSLIQSFGVNAEQLGQISAAYFYGNVGFLFAAGLLLDRFSTRNLIIVTLAASIAGTLLFSFSTGFWSASLSRVLVGIGGAFCFLSSVRIVSRWFPPRRMALVIGLIVTIAMVGGMVAQTPLTVLTDHLGWRQAMWIDSIIGIGMLLLIMVFVKDAPVGYDYAAEKTHVSDLSLLASIGRVLKNPQNWFAGLFTSMLNLPVFLLGAMWGGLLLVEAHGLTRASASTVTMMIFVGMIFGAPFFGWFSDRMRKRRPAMIMGAVATIASLVAIIYVPNLSYDALLALFFVLGFASGAQVLGYPMVAESNPLSLTGTAEGMASTMIMAGGFTQPLFGWVMDMGWHHQFVNHVPLYTPTAFNHAMLIMPIAAVIGLAMCLLAKETNCQHLKRIND